MEPLQCESLGLLSDLLTFGGQKKELKKTKRTKKIRAKVRSKKFE
jgi:hypothetical protein